LNITLIINSIVCLLGTAAGLMLAMGSIISIANMKVPWANLLIVAALGVPVAFAVSGIGAWIAHGRGAGSFVTGLIAFPWIYVAVFVVLMLVSFKS